MRALWPIFTAETAKPDVKQWKPATVLIGMHRNKDEHVWIRKKRKVEVPFLPFVVSGFVRRSGFKLDFISVCLCCHVGCGTQTTMDRVRVCSAPQSHFQFDQLVVIGDNVIGERNPGIVVRHTRSVEPKRQVQVAMFSRYPPSLLQLFHRETRRAAIELLCAHKTRQGVFAMLPRDVARLIAMDVYESYRDPMWSRVFEATQPSESLCALDQRSFDDALEKVRVVHVVRTAKRYGKVLL